MHICVEAQDAGRLQAMHDFKFGGIRPTRVWGHEAPRQTFRLSACFHDVKRYSMQEDTWASYEWIVRSRPDLYFPGEVSTGRLKAVAHCPKCLHPKCVPPVDATRSNPLPPPAAEQVPTLTGRPTDAVYGRARMTGGHAASCDLHVPSRNAQDRCCTTASIVKPQCSESENPTLGV